MPIFTQNDTGAILKVIVTDQDGDVVDLTGYTVRIFWSLNGDGPNKRTMTVTDAANGKAQYQFATGELGEEGSAQYEIELTDGSSNIVTSGAYSFDVRDRMFPEGA